MVNYAAQNHVPLHLATPAPGDARALVIRLLKSFTKERSSTKQDNLFSIVLLFSNEVRECPTAYATLTNVIINTASRREEYSGAVEKPP